MYSNRFREDKLVERARTLKVNVGTDPGADLGPVISKQVWTWFKLYNFCYQICF